jgi:thioredoxin-related protein
MEDRGMKRVLGLFVALGLTACAARAVTWQEDVPAALDQAKESGRYVLMNFTGTDWCVWCIRLDREVFQQPEYKSFADGNLVQVMVDFPKRKAQTPERKQANAELMKKYGVQGYPTLILLAPDGREAARMGYRRGGAAAYVDHLKSLIEADKAKAPVP